ncbi:GlsB/YeaQ/YmgE family stress response membrane protein [Terricaulis sp.]|uniref:GlsB/YeaQ/YmgE family stress response membrane protein n=1 Tax=Terricaulis sp. TaxID=2768686 RepID=UPI002AC3CEC2|nr:GlsB/YeaQ/YmgE family stress response membrane protein [Terricaulis sp.]MDZ4690240.1 GlsB/YeaQ/YmgE family stress response membrane protein [Terricaulis sp.]
MNEVSIIGAIIIGIAAGWIAEQVMGRKHGLVTNLIVGIVGAFLGALIANLLGIAFAGFWGSLLISAVGAILLLWIVGMVRRKPIA